MTPPDPDGRDPGLAAERTDLAWNRSGLSLLACAFAIARGIARPPLDHTETVVGACVLGLAAVVYSLSAWRALTAGRRAGRPATAGDLLPIALGVAGVGIGALLIALFAPG